jgi:hypothetical protein
MQAEISAFFYCRDLMSIQPVHKQGGSHNKVQKRKGKDQRSRA